MRQYGHCLWVSRFAFGRAVSVAYRLPVALDGLGHVEQVAQLGLMAGRGQKGRKKNILAKDSHVVTKKKELFCKPAIIVYNRAFYVVMAMR